MQMAEIPDTTGIDPTPRFDPVPRDKYPVEIVHSEKKATNNGRGAYLEFEEEIISGPFAGRKLWDRLNLWNENTQTVEIAQRQLAQICNAVGMIGVRESEQLHHKAMLAHVKYIPEGPDKNNVFRDAKNEVGGYSPINAQQAAQQPRIAAAAAARQASQQAANAPPWRRPKPQPGIGRAANPQDDDIPF
jgi:Protein of unknown function (DUF669)